MSDKWWEEDTAVRADVGPEAVLSSIAEEKKRQEDQALLHEAHQSIEKYGEIPSALSQIVTDTAAVGERLIGMSDRADEVNRKSDILSQALSERDRAAWRADESPKGMSTLEQAGQYIPWLKQGVRGAVRSLGSAVLGAKGAGAIAGAGKIAAGATRGAVAGGVAGAAQGAGIAARGALGAGGSAYGAIGLASAQEANRAITEASDAGLKGSALAGYVASQGVIEALPATVMQRLGLGGVEAMIAGPAIRGGIKAGFIEAIKATGQEIPEELATEVLHAVASEYSGLDPQALDSDRLSSLVADTVLQTVLMGAGAGAMQTASGAIQARDEQRLTRLQGIRAKGFVSAEDAKKEGIEGKNRKERLANADIQIEEELKKPALEAPTGTEPQQPATVPSQVPEPIPEPAQTLPKPATLETPVAEQESVSKEPWQMTAEAWSKWEADAFGDSPKPVSKMQKEWHKGHVRDAIAEGKQVPAEVLAEYPELSKVAPATELPKPPATSAPQQTEATKPVDPVSELDQAGDELAGLFGEEETPAPKPTEKASQVSQDVPIAETFDDIDKLPKHSVYQRDFKGSRKFMVRSDGKRGGGDGIFDTEQEARKYADTEKTREKERAESEQRRIEDEAEAQRKEKEYVDSYKGFESGNPMKFGKSRKALEKRFNDKGTPRTRKEIIEDRIANGWTIKDGEFQGPDGRVLTEQDLTITGKRYAEHLLNDAAEKKKPSAPESKWSSETRAKLESVPALKGAKVEADEKSGTVKVTRPDGLATTIQFNADEELAVAAKKRGRKPESIHGWYIRKPGESQGRILVHSKANHSNILNHEVMHWLEDSGVVTKDEVEQYGGREAIAEKYGKWAELKQRKKDTVLQRIYDALEPVFSSQRRFFEEVGKRTAEPKSSPIGDKTAVPPQASADQVNVDSGEESKVKPELAPDTARLQAERDSKEQAKTEKKQRVAPEGYASLPEKTRTKFESAWDGTDQQAMKDLLGIPNKALRAEFERRSDSKLPRTVKGTKDIVDEVYAARTKPSESVAKEMPPHVAAFRAVLGDEYADRNGAAFDRYFNEFDSLDEDTKNREYRSNERRGKAFQSELGAKVTYAGNRVGLTGDGMQRVMDAIKQEEKAEKAKTYPERPHGETGDELVKRIAGREWHEVTKADFLRWAAGEYLAGGARKDKLVDDYKLGTEEQRRKFHEQAVASAIKEGKSVPPEVLSDYQKTSQSEQPKPKKAIGRKKPKAEVAAKPEVKNRYGNTPIGKLFAEAKAAGGDAMLFFRMGDFYELYFEDAQKAAKMLGLTLTTRDKAGENPVPMAGFPYHQLDGYLKKLKSAGIRVAVNEEPFAKHKAKAKAEPKATASEAVTETPHTAPAQAYEWKKGGNGIEAAGLKGYIRTILAKDQIAMDGPAQDAYWISSPSAKSSEPRPQNETHYSSLDEAKRKLIEANEKYGNKEAPRENLFAKVKEAVQEKKKQETPPSTPVQAEFMEMSNGVNAPGVKQTIRVTAGERTLLMERSKHSGEWSIKEADEYKGEVQGKTPVKTKGEVFVSGIVETKKAKEVAQRIIDGTFDKDADKRFVREDTQNIGLTNSGIAESMKDSLVIRDSFAKLLRETGLATDGRLLMKVSDKDRDAILKAVGETFEGKPLNTVAQMMTDGQKALSRSANAMKPIGFRGGYLESRTVVLQSQDGDSAILDKVLHDTILKKYPDAVPYFKEEGGPVSYASKGDLVAIVMPMNMDKPDPKVKELVAGKYDFEAEATEAAKFPPPTPKTKLKKAAEKANKELANAVDEFGNVIKRKLGSNLPLNPEVIAAAAKVVAKAIQAGTLNFAELMERMVMKYGEKMAERMRGVLQQEWDKQVNSNPIAEDGIPPETPQPHPELVKPEPIPLTSVKNAIVDELRVQRGEDPMPEVTPETVQQWLEVAGNRIANDPYAGNTLVEQLLTGSKTSVDEMEGMVLQYHYRAVNNLFEAADAKLTEARATGEPAAIAIAQDEAKVIMRRLAAIEMALDKAGTAWGRAGVSRQIFLKQDFSLGSMVRRARVANGGNELSDAQVAIISEQADRIGKLQQQLAEVESKLEAKLAEQEQAKVIDDAIKKDVEETKKPAVKPKSRMRVKAEARVASAWDKFRAAKGQLYSNVDPRLLQPAVEVIKAYVDLGIVTFREFMSTAAQNMGANEAKASEPTFKAAWDQLKEEGETAQPELDLANLGKLTRFAKQVQRTMVENGITEREEVVDAVHEALQEIVPEITRRQTMDALSSYGQFAQLSKDPIDQIIRDINGQLQQLSKLEDMEKGQAPAKTGVERRSPTDEERRLTQLVNEAKRRGGFVVTDPETQLKSAMGAAKTAVKNRIADMNYEIKTGSRVVRSKTELIPDAELEQLRKDRDELQKVHKEMFPPKGATEAQKVAAASRALDAAIASLEAKLAVGDISPAPQPKPLSTPEIDAKRARLKELHDQRDALRKIANPNMTDEQKKIRSLDRSIEALEDQLATGDFTPKPKPAPLTSPEINARQAKLEELRATKKAILDALNPKMTPEQRASRAYEAHLRKQLATYLEKIAQGDFAPREKKPPRVLTKGELDLKKQLADVKHDFFEALAKYHLDNLSPGGRAIDIVRESAHLSRAIMTSIDLSAVLRQGGLGVYSHPVMAKKAAAEMWSAIWSREKEFQSMEKLRTRPNAQLYEESGLNITDSEGKLTRQEEAFMGRWARTGIDFAGSKVQTVSKVALEPVAASARAYVTFINNLRADLFDVMVENLGPGGQVTKEEARLIATYINAATGRADLKSLNEKAATLNTVFFAPRYVVSRFQYLAMPFYLMGTKDSGRVKKLIATEYARTFTGATVFLGSLTVLAYLAALAAGDDEEMPSLEINPLSSDFGKLRIDETRLDPLAGLAQVIVFSSRMASFHTKNSETGKIKPFYKPGPYKTTHASELARFARTKLAPVPGAVWTAFSGMEDVVGDPVTPQGLVGGLFVPISVGEVWSTMQHRGIPKGAALNVLNLMGASVNTYGPKTAYLDATPEEKAKQVNDYIKYMDWESELPAFSQYLSPEDLKKVQNRQDERRGDLVFEAMKEVLPKKDYKTDVHYEEAMESHQKFTEQLDEFRKQYAPTYTDAVRYLEHHYDDEGGVRVKGMRKLKPGFIERRKRLFEYYQDLP